MLLLDDILLSPAKGVMWIFREIHKQAAEEQGQESERIRDALAELYRQLETHRITEDEFEEQEELLLNRLDELEAEEENMQVENVEEQETSEQVDQTQHVLSEEKEEELVD